MQIEIDSYEYNGVDIEHFFYFSIKISEYLNDIEENFICMYMTIFFFH